MNTSNCNDYSDTDFDPEHDSWNDSELFDVGIKCHSCFGTGMDKYEDADCMSCFGEGMIYDHD